MERKASNYLRAARDDEQGSEQSDLQPENLAAFHRIRRQAVTWAMIYGTISGTIIGGGEIVVRLIILDNPDSFEWREHLWTWTGFYAFVGLVTIVEIGLLYWNALRGIARLAAHVDVPFDGDTHSELMISGLARVGLELPNPRQKIYGVDPYALTSRWMMLIQNLLYKLKVGASSFVIRILMRRVFARAFLRGLIPLLAIPLYALWNAFITWRVINGAWLRALGPFLVNQVQDSFSKPEDSLSEDGREVILQGVGEMIRRSGDAHPNHVLLLSRMIPESGDAGGELKVDWQSRHDKLSTLTDDEKAALCAVLTRTAFLAGKPRKSQRTFLRQVHEDCGAEYNAEEIESVRKDLMKGISP